MLRRNVDAVALAVILLLLAVAQIPARLTPPRGQRAVRVIRALEVVRCTRSFRDLARVGVSCHQAKP
jgi:hypothetical protein